MPSRPASYRKAACAAVTLVCCAIAAAAGSSYLIWYSPAAKPTSPTPPPYLPAAPPSCPSGYSCYSNSNASDFDNAIRRVRCPAWPRSCTSHKLALLCSWDEPCHITGTQLGGQAMKLSLSLANVVLADNQFAPVSGKSLSTGGALLSIWGSVTATNVTFRNGTTTSTKNAYGGCVSVASGGGAFICTDCRFEDCYVHGWGGGVVSSGNLILTRPVFDGNTCEAQPQGRSRKTGDASRDSSPVCGAACMCFDYGKCEGCQCAKGGPVPGNHWYCAGESSASRASAQQE